MNTLHRSQIQITETDESIKMQTLRKEVMAACAAIIIASAPMETRASDTYENGIIYLNNPYVSANVNYNPPQNQLTPYGNFPTKNPSIQIEDTKREKVIIENSETPQKSPLRRATVNGAMSVEKFMLDNFGTKEGWDLLVDAGTVGRKGGDRVRKADRDLYRGHTYFLARSSEEADMISRIIREKSKRKIENTSQSAETHTHTGSIGAKPKKGYTVTRSDLDEEANNFLTRISSQQKSMDKGTMYQFRLPENDMKTILKKIGLSDIHMPVINTLMFNLAKDESGLNYGAFGPLITHKSSHRGHRAIGLIQIMPLNWVAWSKKHFGMILEPTDINQEKVGFAQIAEYYKKYIERGYSLQKITEELAIAWYGSVEVKGLRSPSDYAKGFINSVFSDTTRVAEAKRILAIFKKGIPVENIQAGDHTTVVPGDKISMEIQPSQIVKQVALNTETVIHKTPAVNDPLYFKSSPSIISGMNKVIDLSKYLKDKTSEREAEKIFRAQLPHIGNTISTCQKELVNPANKADLKTIIENQIQLGKALTEAMTLAQDVAPNSAFAEGIKDTESKMAKVLNFQTVLEDSLAKKAKQKSEEQRQARIASMQLDSVAFAERALGLRAA